MKSIALLAVVCLTLSAFCATVNIDDSREAVLNALGNPKGMMQGGSREEVLLFANGTVILEHGKVVEVKIEQQKPLKQCAALLRYAFDETGSTIPDHSGQGNSAISHGAVPCADGKHAGAYTFNGRDAYMQLSRDLDLAQPYTIAVWVYLKSRLEETADFPFYRGRTILSRGDLNRSGAWDYIFNVNAYGKLGFVTHSTFSKADNLQNPERFPLNRWVFVAFTHQGDVGRLYEDGRLVQTHRHMSAGGRHRRRDTYIGKIYNSSLSSRGDHFWDGMIDELRVYATALSEQELSALQRERPPVANSTARPVDVATPGRARTAQPVEPPHKNDSEVVQQTQMQHPSDPQAPQDVEPPCMGENEDTVMQHCGGPVAAYTQKNGTAYKLTFRVGEVLPQYTRVTAKYPSGRPKCVFLGKPAKVQGVVCHHRTLTTFHANGQLETADLSGEQTIQGVKCEVGSSVGFFESGALEYAKLAPGKPQMIGGLQCAAKAEIDFFESGAIESTTLGADQVIKDVKYAKDSKIEFYPDSRVKSGTLAADAKINGIPFKKGQEVTFPEQGRILSQKLEHPAVILGVPCFATQPPARGNLFRVRQILVQTEAIRQGHRLIHAGHRIGRGQHR